jgi:hypothetical protein
MQTSTWFGFEGEGHEGGQPVEYGACAEDLEMSPADEAAHAEYAKRVAAEYGFPLADWQPTIPTRDLV